MQKKLYCFYYHLQRMYKSTRKYYYGFDNHDQQCLHPAFAFIIFNLLILLCYYLIDITETSGSMYFFPLTTTYHDLNVFQNTQYYRTCPCRERNTGSGLPMLASSKWGRRGWESNCAVLCYSGMLYLTVKYSKKDSQLKKIK